MDPTFEHCPYLDEWLRLIKSDPTQFERLPESARLVLELYEREKTARECQVKREWSR